MSRRGFTLLELVFVIAVIGILSAIAIPKFVMTRNDAVVTRARATVGALRSAIATERQKKILKGDFADLDGTAVEALLEYGLSDDWTRSGNDFVFTAPNGNTCTFTVSNNKLVKGTCNVDGLSDL
jgi:general secretion pathway protein G